MDNDREQVHRGKWKICRTGKEKVKPAGGLSRNRQYLKVSDSREISKGAIYLIQVYIKTTY